MPDHDSDPLWADWIPTSVERMFAPPEIEKQVSEIDLCPKAEELFTILTDKKIL